MEEALPHELSFALAGANPVVGTATFHLGLPVRARVELTIHDVAGRQVARLVDDELEAGRHTVRWESRRPRAAGVYFARLEAEGRAPTRRIVVLH